MGKKPLPPKKQIYSFLEKLAAVNSENRRGLWKLLLLALLYAMSVYLYEMKSGFFFFFVEPQIYSLRPGNHLDKN